MGVGEDDFASPYYDVDNNFDWDTLSINSRERFIELHLLRSRLPKSIEKSTRGWRKTFLSGVLKVWRVETGIPGGGGICLSVTGVYLTVDDVWGWCHTQTIGVT